MCKRGEVYYIRYNDAIGAEQFVGRPGIIVSSNQSCDLGSVVQIVYTTTQYREYWFNPVLNSTNRRSWALCEQITTVDKVRLGDRMCTLTDEEMAEVDEALRKLLSLEVPVVDDSEKDTRIAELEAESLDWQIEADCYKRMYEKAMEKLSEKRLSDYEFAGTVVAAAEEPGPEKLNVNVVYWQELVDKVGMSESLAKNIVNYRTENGRFESVVDLKKVPRFGNVCLERYGNMLTVG